VLQVPEQSGDDENNGGTGNNDEDVQAQFDALYNSWKHTGDFQALSIHA
jgi:hypothetical protein